MKPKKPKNKVLALLERSNGVVLGAGSSMAVHAVRRAVHEVIPGDFHWWMEIEPEIGQSIRWIWLGHTAVSHIGGVSDPNVAILVDLLRGVNWESERAVAIESVEGYEQAALQVAQEKRKNRFLGRSKGKLDEVRMPEPPPLSIEGKRIVHRVGLARAGYAAAVDEKLRKQHAALAEKPTSPEIRNYRVDSSRPQFAVTKSKGYLVRAWQWEPFESLEDVQERLASEPAESFTHICVYGFVMDNVERWRDAWISTRPLRELHSAIFAAEQRGEDVTELTERLKNVLGESAV